MPIPHSELILNPDGSVYHLELLPHQIAHDIVTVGDPDRVDHVSQHFDIISHVSQKREFKTTTGTYRGRAISCISTGIGTDNIDIVLNELDALVNIDLQTREIKDRHTSLRLYRIGTSGALRKEVDVDSVIISKYAIGLEGLMNYYAHPMSSGEKDITAQAREAIQDDLPLVMPYASTASSELMDRFISIGIPGITVTATGFYGPQGRSLRLHNRSNTFLDLMASVSHADVKTTNLEMETAGIYGLASALGHHAISFNAILANRPSGVFSTTPSETVDKLIRNFLDIWSTT